jgi:hypothetical protein
MKIDLDRIAKTFNDVEFFVAGIFADAPPAFTGTGSGLVTRVSPQFWAVTSLSTAHGRGLVHEVDGSDIVFRGYEGGLSVHSYSEAEVLKCLANEDGLQNGVFAYIKFDRQRQQAIVRSDAFGFGPVYYRRLGSAWLFASHPALLHVDGDEPDMIGWAGLMQNSSPVGDRSFYRDIARVPAGTQMTLWPERMEKRRWFDFAALPAGTRRIDDEAFRVVEEAYQAGFERCLKLNVGEVALPFSSGFDSRRFFATLLRRKVPFKAVTCQTFHRKKTGDFELDSHYAPKIAAAFGVDCEVVPATPPARMGEDAARRQALIGTETFMHAWSLPLMRWLAKRPPSLVFDGLAGDTFGNSGFEIDGLHETAERDVGLVLGETSKPYMLKQLSHRFPSLEQFQQQYRAYLDQFASNINQAEMAFIESRTRRCISPWVTMMHPPGHVPVFPYCDVEFARATFEYHPADKYKWFFQKECLRRFYPEFYDFHGSRNMPPDLAPLDPAICGARDEAEERFAYSDFGVVREALPYLTLPNKILLLLSSVLPSLRRRRDWVFHPLLLLARTKKHAETFIDPNPTSTAISSSKQTRLQEVTSLERGAT